MSDTDYRQHMDYIARMVEQEQVTDEWVVEQTRIAVAKRSEQPASTPKQKIAAQKFVALQNELDKLEVEAEINATEPDAQKVADLQAKIEIAARLARGETTA